MSSSTGPEDWGRWKNAIHTLYILENRFLQGPHGVIKLMEDRYQFKATKAQYEKHFKEWSFQKKRTKEDWRIIDQKVDKRKRAGKESNVYADGLLIPAKRLRKETSRQGHMSVVEHLNWAQAPSPRTPSGFQVRTPSNQPVYRLAFEELPILQFQGAVRTFAESFQIFNPNLDALVSFLRGSRKSGDINPMLSVINSLLPNSALVHEEVASNLAIEKVDQLGSIEFLNLTTYLISNNLPAESNGKMIYKWLKTHGKSSLNVLRSMKGPSAEAMLEKLFRLAVEAEDLPIVKDLVQTGLNPNGSSCMMDLIPEPLSPLQFACLQGNVELAQELIKAGSSIDEPGSGWKSSALVLAIFGRQKGSKQTLVVDEFEGDDDGSEEEDDTEEEDDNDLVTLVNSLIDAGARVNLDYAESYEYSESFRKFTWHVHCGNPLYPLVKERHSALTMASKYRQKEIVELLTQKGADVRFKMGEGNSPLRECIYCSEDWYFTCRIANPQEPIELLVLSEHRPYTLGSKRRSSIVSVVHSLIDAGVELNDHVPCDEIDFCMHDSLECYSTLDLAVLTGSMELIDLMLCAGAYATKHSLEYALKVRSFKIFDRLLNAGAPLPEWATSETDDIIYPSAPTDAGLVSTNIQDCQKKRAAIIAAIRLGETAILDDLIKSLDFYSSNILDGCSSLAKAIEDCCRNGNLEVIGRLLDGSIIDQRTLTPQLGHSVYISIHGNHEKLVDLLLNAGADVNARLAGETPLILAIRKRNSELVRKLLNAGAKSNSESRCGGLRLNHKRYGDVLVAAIDEGNDIVIEDVIRAGADINAPGNKSRFHSDTQCRCCTPLTIAILRERWKLVDWLLDAGAAINHTADMNCVMTPLWAAVHCKNISLVRSLLEAGARADDMHALEEATNDIEVLQLLITRMGIHNDREKPSNVGRRALDKSIKKKSLDIVELILESKLVDINALDDYSTPLHVALYSNSDHCLELIKLLLRFGADPNGIVCYFQSESRTALLDAIETQDHGSVQLLLEAGAKVNGNFEAGVIFSPVQFAAQNGNLDILRVLLKNGSNPNLLAAQGKSGAAIQIAAENRDLEIVRTLLKHNTNPDTISGSWPHTALQMASRDGCKEIVELLIEYGADVNSPPAEKYGATALQFAAIGGYLGIAHLLLEKEADVNAPSATIGGRTALEGAAEHGRIDMVQMLINVGADISEAGQGQYERALMRASKNGHHATRRLLESLI